MGQVADFMAKKKMQEDALGDGNPAGEQDCTSTCQSSPSPIFASYCAHHGNLF
jgi:hypothetical protein